MKNCLKTGIERNLWKLRQAETRDLLTMHFGLASGFIDAAFSAQDDVDVVAWTRMSELAINAWKIRDKELSA